MKQNKKAKLPNLKIEGIYSLNLNEMKSIKGGIYLTSIGLKCSLRIKCDRLWTKCWGDTNGDLPGGECQHKDILHA